MRYANVGYAFAIIVFLYGLIAVVWKSIWLRDPGGSGHTVEGMAAVLMGVSFMLLGYLILTIVHYVASNKEQRLDPFTFGNKVLWALWLILATVGGLWDVF